NHYSIMSHVMEQVHEVIAERGLADATHIMMAHLFAAGATGSESERNIGEDIGQGSEVGTLGQVPADMFVGMDYVALGHLHGRQWPIRSPSTTTAKACGYWKPTPKGLPPTPSNGSTFRS